MNRPSEAESRALLAAGNLAVDAVTAEVVSGLRAEGVRSILLRGPAIGRWLYGGSEEPLRTYDDLDLLIASGDIDRSHRVLEGLGFINWFASLAPGETVEHASEWRREGSAVPVDLHRTLQGVKADAAELWAEMTAGAEQLAVSGTLVEVPGEAARVAIVVLHAAQHGIREPKPLRDLRLVVNRVDPGLWSDAARLAERLSATPAFAAGLLLLPEGAELAEQLGVAAAVDTEAALYAQSPAPTASGFAHLAAMPGLRAKLRFLARKLVPTPAFMRHAFPVARRGRLGLLLAYAWRPIWLLAHAGPGLAAWLRARR